MHQNNRTSISKRIGIHILTIICATYLCSCKHNSIRTELSASGIMQAVEVDVSCIQGGQIEKYLVEEGDFVSTGDTVVIIDHSSLDIQLKSAEASLKMANAQLSLVQKGARSEDLAIAQQTVKSAQANFMTAESDYNRIRNLYDAGSASEKQMQQAESRFISAKSNLNSAMENLEKLRNLIRPEEIDIAKAKVMMAESNLNLLTKKISDCYITAPVSGIVTGKGFEEGETAVPGMMVVQITQTEKMYLTIYISEDDLGFVNIQQEAVIRIDGYDNRKFSGKVVYISPSAEFTPKNVQTKDDRIKLVYAVKLKVDNTDNILKSGMFADAILSK